MGFQMKFSQDELKGQEPIPAGIYKVRFVEFKPKKSKNSESINLNGWVVILDHPEWEKERKLVANLNQGIPSFIQDFVHSFGLEMVDHPDGSAGIPGVWDGTEGQADTYKYQGPLVGKVAEWEVGMGEYQGKPTNVIRKFICKVPNCAQKFLKIQHATDMAKKS